MVTLGIHVNCNALQDNLRLEKFRPGERVQVSCFISPQSWRISPIT